MIFLNFVPQIYTECHSVILHGLLGFEGVKESLGSLEGSNGCAAELSGMRYTHTLL